uniref:Uncharacterized protein n=1 Tax=Anguilla anguilla TaxID=7936 RepID=A0A0E9ULD0_ANGAN
MVFIPVSPCEILSCEIVLQVLEVCSVGLSSEIV